MSFRELLPTLFCAFLFGGCFPYRQVYRPQSHGVVLNTNGTPAAGERVIACSESKWIGFQQTCARKGTAVTDNQGRFAFPELREWDWCCLGEAPLPLTVVLTCGNDGSIDGLILHDHSEDDIKFVLGQAHDVIRAGFIPYELSKEDAARYCTQ